MAAKIATNTRLSRTELTGFLAQRHHTILVARKRDGSPQVSPVTSGIDDDGRLLIATYPQRAKVANLRRDPTVTACVMGQDFNDAWIQIDGTAEVLDLPAALDPLVTYFRSISGEHSDWQEYREAMRRQGKCVVRITPHSWGPAATGGFPPEIAEQLG